MVIWRRHSGVMLSSSPGCQKVARWNALSFPFTGGQCIRRCWGNQAPHAGPSPSSNFFHECHENNSFDCLVPQHYITKQTIEHNQEHKQEEMNMRANGHATVWGTHVSFGRDHRGVFPHLLAWFASKVQKDRNASVVFNAEWDARREKVVPLRADSAWELTAARSPFPTATMVYSSLS